MFQRIHIRKHEEGLLFVKGDFSALLAPGTHVLPAWPLRQAQVEVFNRLDGKFEHPMLDVLVQEPALRVGLQVVELSDHERALVWKDGRLAWFLGPGRHAFWTGPLKLNVEVFDIGAFRFAHPKLETVLAHPVAGRHLESVSVEASERALLFRDGQLVETLAPGRHVFWKQTGKLAWTLVDLREQTQDIAGQEIMTADKVTLRVNLVVTYQVTDVVKSATVVSDHAQALYREAQLVLRAAVGTRTLDQLLSDKEAIGAEVRNTLSPRAAEFGVTVRSVGMRDLILPGDMKTLLNQVIEAQKQAEANLIKRREETAAARSQVNTAKLLAENPALARMKELEAMQEVLRGAKLTLLVGGGDLTRQVRQLVAEPPESPEAPPSASGS